MSFFDVLGRLLRGQQPFVAPEQPRDPRLEPAPTPQSSPSSQTKSGPKITPRLTVGWMQSRINGTRMTCECDIRNDSQEVLDLDKVRILGTVYDLGTKLRPGESRRLTIYNGNRPTSNHDHECSIDYITDPGGDYFRLELLIDYQKQADNTYTIYRLRPAHIEDI